MCVASAAVLSVSNFKHRLHLRHDNDHLTYSFLPSTSLFYVAAFTIARGERKRGWKRIVSRAIVFQRTSAAARRVSPLRQTALLQSLTLMSVTKSHKSNPAAAIWKRVIPAGMCKRSVNPSYLSSPFGVAFRSRITSI